MKIDTIITPAVSVLTGVGEIEGLAFVRVEILNRFNYWALRLSYTMRTELNIISVLIGLMVSIH